MLTSEVTGAVDEHYESTHDIRVEEAVNEIYNATWTNTTDGECDWNSGANIDVDTSGKIYLN